MRICILLRSFTLGGSEHQAAITAAELTRRGHDVDVVVLHDGDAYADVLAGAGITPFVLPGGRATLPGHWVRRLWRQRPDVVLSYLAGPNLLAVAARLVRNRPLIVWGVRSTTLRLADETRLGGTVYRLEPRFTRWADVVVANSQQARRDAIARGLRNPHFEVVPNGVDCDRGPDRGGPGPDRRAVCRAELGLPATGPVIGRVGRVHPMKDLPTLFRAVARLPAPTRPTIAVVGDGDPDYVGEMRGLARALGMADNVRWLGERSDLRRLYPALDLVVSSSAYGEGFPNVVAEAMAAGIVCVGTDVGDTATLIDDDRRVVPPEDAEALSTAVQRVLDLDDHTRRALGAAGQARVCDRFGIDALGRRLESILVDAVAERERR